MAVTKLGIIGAGTVGTAVAVGVAALSAAHTIVLHDLDGARPAVEAEDLQYGSSWSRARSTW